VVLKRSYAMADFSKDYFSYKGNAYGLANTLLQVRPASAAVAGFGCWRAVRWFDRKALVS
jgi:hypothetical protein